MGHIRFFACTDNVKGNVNVTQKNADLLLVDKDFSLDVNIDITKYHNHNHNPRQMHSRLWKMLNNWERLRQIKISFVKIFKKKDEI
jgi:hypothetical protein